VDNNKHLKGQIKVHEGLVRCMRFFNDDTQLVSCSTDDTIKIFDVVRTMGTNANNSDSRKGIPHQNTNNNNYVGSEQHRNFEKVELKNVLTLDTGAERSYDGVWMIQVLSRKGRYIYIFFFLSKTYFYLFRTVGG